VPRIPVEQNAAHVENNRLDHEKPRYSDRADGAGKVPKNVMMIDPVS
jgi:hypothetical protein